MRRRGGARCAHWLPAVEHLDKSIAWLYQMLIATLWTRCAM